MPGLVLGGGNMGFHVLSPKVKIGDSECGGDGALAGNLLGFYVDYYVNENEGLHTMALIGLATLDDADDDTDKLAVGFGSALGVGHDWWIADDWSVGVLGRIQFMTTSLEHDTTNADVTFVTLAPALLLTSTYH